MTIAEALAALLAELEEGDVPDPLAQRFSLALVWADLARLAGEPVPPAVAAVLDAPAAAPVPDLAFARRLLDADPEAFAAIRAEEAHRAYVADAARWLPAD